jgi:hypothetical protein
MMSATLLIAWWAMRHIFAAFCTIRTSASYYERLRLLSISFVKGIFALSISAAFFFAFKAYQKHLAQEVLVETLHAHSRKNPPPSNVELNVSGLSVELQKEGALQKLLEKGFKIESGYSDPSGLANTFLISTTREHKIGCEVAYIRSWRMACAEY